LTAAAQQRGGISQLTKQAIEISIFTMGEVLGTAINGRGRPGMGMREKKQRLCRRRVVRNPVRERTRLPEERNNRVLPA
jgi:hypothetical protein